MQFMLKSVCHALYFSRIYFIVDCSKVAGSLRGDFFKLIKTLIHNSNSPFSYFAKVVFDSLQPNGRYKYEIIWNYY